MPLHGWVGVPVESPLAACLSLPHGQARPASAAFSACVCIGGKVGFGGGDDTLADYLLAASCVPWLQGLFLLGLVLLLRFCGASSLLPHPLSSLLI